MKHIFIINPTAGKSDSRQRIYDMADSLRLKHGLDVQCILTKRQGHATELARKLCQTGEDLRFYACGGDGTLNEVVNGAAGYQNVAVTTFAGGSGNDFARMFSQPEAFRDLERLLDAEEAEFDLIRCNDSYSLNICSVGLDARIGHDVADYKRLPLLSGFRAYAVSSVVNVVKGIHEHYVVEVDGERIDGRFTLICACNGRFYGGGFNPVPTADPTDGKLEVLLVRDVSRLKVLQVIGAYKNGRYAEFPELIRHFSTDRVRILCDRPTGINLDGERRVDQLVDMRIAEEKLRFFYPKGLTYLADIDTREKASR